MLDVSNMTVRRDVNNLVNEGKVIKTIGGAHTANAHPSLHESSILCRLSVSTAEKRAIAAKALEFIENQQSIYLDGSTTCLELSKLLSRSQKSLTIVTNSILVCMELTKARSHTILCIGGQHDRASFCFTGPRAQEEAGNLFVDIAFFSTKGFLPSEGTFESSVPTFRIKQIMAKQCQNVVLIVDHSKFGQRSLYKVLDIEQVGTVITDDHTSDEDVEELEKRAISVRIAPVKTETNVV